MPGILAPPGVNPLDYTLNQLNVHVEDREQPLHLQDRRLDRRAILNHRIDIDLAILVHDRQRHGAALERHRRKRHRPYVVQAVDRSLRLRVGARIRRQQPETDGDRRPPQIAGAQLVGLVRRRDESEPRRHREIHDDQRHQRDSQQNRQQRHAAFALSHRLHHCVIAIGTVTCVAKSITRPPGAAILI